eukprot:SAG31_NODE_9969_length_1203_cov_0.976449_1_plen_370_part_01
MYSDLFSRQLVESINDPSLSVGPLSLDLSDVSSPSTPIVRTRFRYEIEVGAADDVDAVFSSLSPHNSDLIAGHLGVNPGLLSVDRPSTNIPDGACASSPCLHGAACYGSVNVYMCGDPLPMTIRLGLDSGTRADEVAAAFAAEMSDLLSLPAYRLQIGNIFTSGGQIEFQLLILPPASDQEATQETAAEQVASLMTCGAVACDSTDTFSDNTSNGDGRGYSFQIEGGSIQLLAAQIADDANPGCPEGFSGLHCERIIDGCAAAPCQHSAECHADKGGIHMCGASLELTVELALPCLKDLSGAVQSVSCTDTSQAAAIVPEGFYVAFRDVLAGETDLPQHRLHLLRATLDRDAHGSTVGLGVRPPASTAEV